MPQLPADQLDAIRALLPTPGDPPAVAAQKSEALRTVVTQLRRQGVNVPDPPPDLFAGGRPQERPSGATGTWDRPSPLAGVPPQGATPLKGTGYGRAALGDVERARGREDSTNRGAAFSADPRKNSINSVVNAAVDQAAAGDGSVEMMQLTDPPQFKRATITNADGSPLPRAGGSLNLADYTGPAAAPPPAPPKAPAPPIPTSPAARGVGSLNLGTYTGQGKSSPYALDDEDAPAPPPRPGSLNFSDYTSAGRTSPYDAAEAGAAPAAPARGAARPAAKAPPPPGRASVPASYLGPDVEAQGEAAFARQSPSPLGSAGAQAATALRPTTAPPATLAPSLQQQELVKLLSGAPVAAQIGGAPVALGDAPAPPEAPAEVDPEVLAMVETLLAEARRGRPMVDTFRHSAGRKGRGAYFGGK